MVVYDEGADYVKGESGENERGHAGGAVADGADEEGGSGDDEETAGVKQDVHTTIIGGDFLGDDLLLMLVEVGGVCDGDIGAVSNLSE